MPSVEEQTGKAQAAAASTSFGGGAQQQQRTTGGSGSPRPVVVCGPSGVGKGTLIAKLMEAHAAEFGFCVSHTTRAPRPGERDGVHYHFAEKTAMQADVDQGKFLEHAQVHDNLYGTSLAAVEAVAAQGKICILDIDVQGARAVKQSPLDALFVFIKPPSFEVLESRLRGRGTESEAAVSKRLSNASAEILAADEPDFFQHVIVNDSLEDAFSQLKTILL